MGGVVEMESLRSKCGGVMKEISICQSEIIINSIELA